MWGIKQIHTKKQKQKKTNKKNPITWPAFTSREIWQGHYFILFGSSLTWKHTGGEGLNGSTHSIAPEAWEGCNPSGSRAGGKEEVNTELHGNKKKKKKGEAPSSWLRGKRGGNVIWRSVCEAWIRLATMCVRAQRNSLGKCVYLPKMDTTLTPRDVSLA